MRLLIGFLRGFQSSQVTALGASKTTARWAPGSRAERPRCDDPQPKRCFSGPCVSCHVSRVSLVPASLPGMTPQRLKLFSGYHHLVTLLLSTITGMSASPLKFAVTRRFDFDGTRLSGRCDPRPCPPRSCAVWTYRPTGASTGSPVYMGKPCAIRVVYNLSFRETRSRETWETWRSVAAREANKT